MCVCVSDLVGELQVLQSGTNTSTAADLLKQGAGEFIYFIYLFFHGWMVGKNNKYN